MTKKKKTPKISKARRKILEWCQCADEDVLFLEGPEYDVAIIGVVTGKGMSARLLYSTDKIIRMLKNQGIQSGLHEDEALEQALEWFSVNTADAWVGEHTPCFLEDSGW